MLQRALFPFISLFLLTASLSHADDRIDAEAATAEGMRNFGFSLFERLKETKPDSPIAISPISLTEAISLAATGSTGKIRAELEDLFLSPLMLRQHADLSVVTAGLKGIRAKLDHFAKVSKTSFAYKSANSLWGNTNPAVGFSFDPTFLKNAGVDYGATLEKRDFAEVKEDDKGKPYNVAVKDINTWVDGHTEHKITKLIDDLGKSDIAVLLNAIYTKGKFKHHFDTLFKADYKLAGKNQPTSFMRKQDTIGYYPPDNVLTGYSFNVEDKAARLPEETNQIALDILVPADGKVADLAKKLTGDFYKHIAGAFKPTLMKLEIASGKVAPGDAYKLKSILEDKPYNVKRAFTGADDEFKPMGAVLPGLHIAISDILTKTFYEVSPFGFEAAAATAVVMLATSAVFHPVVPPTHRIDAPSVHVIRHIPSGTPLFIVEYDSPRLYTLDEQKALVEEGWKHDKGLRAEIDGGTIAAVFDSKVAKDWVLAKIDAKGTILEKYKTLKK